MNWETHTYPENLSYNQKQVNYKVRGIFCISLLCKPCINRHWHFLEIFERACFQQAPDTVSIYCPYFRYLCFSPKHWHLVLFQTNDRCNVGLLPSRMDLPLVLHIPALSKCLRYPSTSKMLWSQDCCHRVADIPDKSVYSTHKYIPDSA